jgi:uncharacterized protein YjbI with pentapeptide repeats
MQKIELHTNSSKFDITIRVLTLIASIIVAFVLIFQFSQTNKQIGLQERGKSADRFRDGIELLDSDKDAIVIGGIYLLDNLAHEYPNEYASQVFDIFCGYLRTDTKLNWKNHLQHYNDSYIIDSLIIAKYEFPNKYQTVLDKVFKDSTQFYKNIIGENYNINLQGVCFVNASLSKGYFKGANFEASNMTWSNLESANFEGANLRFAILNETDLLNTEFVSADMTATKIQGARLFMTQMQGARLDFASMETASLMLASLEGASLVSTHLEGSHIRLSSFKGACLSKVHFEGAIISGSNFKGTSSETGAVEMFIVNDVSNELKELKSENKLYLNGASEFSNSMTYLKYSGGHKLTFLKERAGKPSHILPINNTTNHFGPLNEKDIDSIRTDLIKMSVRGQNQDHILWLINHHNDANEDMYEMFMKGRAILTNEDANKIIRKVNKDLGNY